MILKYFLILCVLIHFSSQSNPVDELKTPESSENVVLYCSKVIKVNQDFEQLVKKYESKIKTLKQSMNEKENRDERSSVESIDGSGAMAMSLISNNSTDMENDRLSNDLQNTENLSQSNEQSNSTSIKQVNTSQIDQQTKIENDENMNLVKNEEKTTLSSVDLKNLQDLNENNDQSPLQARELEQPTTVDSVANLVMNGNQSEIRMLNKTDSIGIERRAIGKDGIFGSFLGKFHSNPDESSKDRVDASLSLVEDEKKMENSFKQAEAAKNQQNDQFATDESRRMQVTSPSTTSTTSTTTSTTTTTTTTTTTPKPSTNTKSPEDEENEKIFEEFFGSRDGHNSNMRIIIDSIKHKFGLGAKHIPPTELKQKIKAELDHLQLTAPQVNSLHVPVPANPSFAPVIASPGQPIAEPILLNSPQPIAAPILVDPKQPIGVAPLPKLPTPVYAPDTPGNPHYLSYDAVQKQLDLEAAKSKNVYPNDKKQGDYLEGAEYDLIKKPLTDDYSTIDKLKGQVNGPVELPSLAVKLPIKPKTKLDYTEIEKPEYRMNNMRLGDLNPFNRVPALSRYSKVVSSVSKGLGSLIPNRQQGPVYPLYGYYQN